ncbi:MITOTIC-SPINDLE ORGANIZING PROTEIN 1A-LIKE [Salix koriyanagi]|uniref:MITOTIC-SPINDLE ORGANIZING PROTEIN 1A-LIKE n=1 Tax=Salix koriyanagi TaxID=2511006 RepID=A0A9Q0VF62_9ROSI|nr:MITOTIC-SPINDLE ORGANIZING PROTEIN 1A-LIKE [Salix koriyanagi]
MDPEAAKTAKESLDLAFHMSNLLNTGLDRHTLSVLIALCDLGLNPEALAAVVKELRSEPVSSSSAPIRSLGCRNSDFPSKQSCSFCLEQEQIKGGSVEVWLLIVYLLVGSFSFFFPPLFQKLF